jgi:hypothetical protein
MRWVSPHWLSGEEMIRQLRALDPADGSGDVYALRADAVTA